MSIANHNAPVQSLHNSKSNRSLYTENSQESDQDLQQRIVSTHDQARLQSLKKEEQPVSQKINKLPTIIQQKDNTNNKINPQPRQAARMQYNDGMPSLPNRSNVPIANLRYKDSHNDASQEMENRGRGFQLGHSGGPQFNTIAITSLQRGEVQNMYGQSYNPLRMTGMSGMSGIHPNNAQNERSRMLRSSQGGRWFRSQSLMQDKPIAEPKKFPTLEPLLHNFHKPNSKYYPALQEYIAFYSSAQSKLKQKSDIFYKFHLNLIDSVQEIKTKMEAYLETRIDLSNLPIDRPDTDWGQQQLVKFYNGYQRIINEVQAEKIKASVQYDDKTVTILKKYKNCAYYGPIRQGKKHGFGYLHYFSGRFYEGLFESDQKVKGFQMDDDQLYLGDYEKNQRHGQGILKTNQYMLSGIFHAGEFKIPPQQKNANETGFSKLTGKNVGTTQAVPAFNNLLRKGFKIEFSSVTFYLGTNRIIEKNNLGDIFIGEINEESQKHGEGLEIFANGDLYIGKYQQGAPEGYGEYYWESGAFYRGEFLSGMRHGKGSWMMVQGDRYEGDYLNDKKNGKGIYEWKSGDRYQGEFENDYRHGYGQMYWRDGTSYKGQWLNGIQANKSFKLDDNTKPTQSSVTKTTNKTIQARTRVLKKQKINVKSVGKNSRHSQHHAHTIQQTSSLPANNPYSNAYRNNKRIPLQKLKAMLNPSNSIN